MIQRIFIHVVFLMLFAVSQTGIAMHEITHIETSSSQSQSDKSDQKTTQEHCDHCIAQADADSANLPATFSLSLSLDQHTLATITVARLVSRLPDLYCARAPPSV